MPRPFSLFRAFRNEGALSSSGGKSEGEAATRAGGSTTYELIRGLPKEQQVDILWSELQHLRSRHACRIQLGNDRQKDNRNLIAKVESLERKKDDIRKQLLEAQEHSKELKTELDEVRKQTSKILQDQESKEKEIHRKQDIEVHKLKNENQSFSTELEERRQEVQSLKVSLNDTISSHEKSIEEKNEDIENLKKEMESLNKKYEHLFAEMKKKEDDCDGHKLELAKKELEIKKLKESVESPSKGSSKKYNHSNNPADHWGDDESYGEPFQSMEQGSMRRGKEINVVSTQNRNSNLSEKHHRQQHLPRHRPMGGSQAYLPTNKRPKNDPFQHKAKRSKREDPRPSADALVGLNKTRTGKLAQENRSAWKNDGGSMSHSHKNHMTTKNNGGSLSQSHKNSGTTFELKRGKKYPKHVAQVGISLLWTASLTQSFVPTDVSTLSSRLPLNEVSLVMKFIMQKCPEALRLFGIKIHNSGEKISFGHWVKEEVNANKILYADAKDGDNDVRLICIPRFAPIFHNFVLSAKNMIPLLQDNLFLEEVDGFFLSVTPNKYDEMKRNQSDTFYPWPELGSTEDIAKAEDNRLFSLRGRTKFT